MKASSDVTKMNKNIKADMHVNMLGNSTEENFRRAQQMFQGGKNWMGMRKISERLYVSRKGYLRKQDLRL